MSWSEITTILLAVSNIMFALFRWADLSEGRKSRRLAHKAREAQMEYNQKVSDILDRLTPKG